MQQITHRRQAFASAVKAVLLLCLVALSACHSGKDSKNSPASSDHAGAASFVGSERCAACHTQAFQAWQTSQHQQAMQTASADSIKAPFAGESLQHQGSVSGFRQEHGQWLIHTQGSDGHEADFPVQYTFGVMPLQQYLLALPGGRLQAFTAAWDTRPAAAGGQRWIDLYPGQPATPGSPQHWSGYQQNWNFMCADCHATHVLKNFNVTDNTFNTTWSELGVGCEACHGAGSAHVQWATNSPRDSSDLQKGLSIRLDERKGIRWQPHPVTGKPQRSSPRSTAQELDVCARCHSRRAQLTDAVTAADPLTQGFTPALIDEDLYFDDGQMREEVYNHVSFLQSRMQAHGVTCSDCHEPHSQTLRAPGDGVCLQCHASASYAQTSHHFHPVESAGARCANCHMPVRTYLQVDQRHDHSLRIPQPAVSAAVGAPDVCTSCHSKRDSRWAQRIIDQHYPHAAPAFQTFGLAFAALRQHQPGAAAAVTAIARDSEQPALVRASALRRLQQAGADIDSQALSLAATHSDALLRMAAAEVASRAPRLLPSLLADSQLAVRLMASQQLTDASGQAAQSALKAYQDSQRYNADRPEHRTNLADSLRQQGNLVGAETQFRAVIAQDSGFTAAYLGLAETQRAQGQEGKAEQTLRAASQKGREELARVMLALGLSLVRQQRYDEALQALADAERRDPDDVQIAYTYCVALQERGLTRQSKAVLQRALKRHPGQTDLLQLLQTYGPAP